MTFTEHPASSVPAAVCAPGLQGLWARTFSSDAHESLSAGLTQHMTHAQSFSLSRGPRTAFRVAGPRTGAVCWLLAVLEAESTEIKSVL